MRHRFLSAWIVALTVFVTGCASPKPYIAIQCPSDKALVYVYWIGWVIPANGVTIHVDGAPEALLHAHHYYPLVLAPGEVELGYTFRVHPIVPIRSGEMDSLTLTLHPGETRYVSYQPWNGSWKPKLVLMDDETGQKEIAKCTLGKALQ